MNQSSKARGFTLIEILAATAIMSVVILVVLSLTTNVLNVWNRSTGKLGSNYEARVALDLMANDLETLVMRNRPFCWIEVNYASPAHPLSYSGALPQMPEMYFMARVEDRPRFNNAGDAIYGDICAVGYRVFYQNPLDPGNQTDFPMFGLYRFAIDSERTFTNVMDTGGDPAPSLSALMTGSKYLDENGEEKTVGSLEGVMQGAENFLSANIVDVRAVFWYLDAESKQLVAITDTGDEHGAPRPFTYTDRLNIVGDEDASGTLEYVDIAITVMSPDGLAVMESNSVTTDTDWFDLVAQYGTTFSRRVQIMAKPL